jgi:hypothetical protein
MNQKGLSSIVGAIFMILIIGSLSSAYFFYTLNENATYNQAIKEQNDFNVARMSEAAQISNTVYTVKTGVITISAKIFNIGSYSMNFSTLWLKVSGDTSASNFSRVNTVIKVGDTYSLTCDIRINGVNRRYY